MRSRPLVLCREPVGYCWGLQEFGTLKSKTLACGPTPLPFWPLVLFLYFLLFLYLLDLTFLGLFVPLQAPLAGYTVWVWSPLGVLPRNCYCCPDPWKTRGFESPALTPFLPKTLIASAARATLRDATTATLTIWLGQPGKTAQLAKHVQCDLC